MSGKGSFSGKGRPSGPRSRAGHGAADGRRKIRSSGRPPPSQRTTSSAPAAETRIAARAAATITIDGEHAGRRLDKYLRSQLRGVPAGLIFQLLRKGKLRVNGRKAEQNYRLVEGDVIEVPALTAQAPAAPELRLPAAFLEQMKNVVVYEDADLLVVDKPAGVAVHKGTDVPGGVIEALRQLRPDLPELELGHRLDRDTSGVLVLAKTPSMLRYLHDLLRDREDEIERHYLALVEGRWPSKKSVLEAPLQRRDTEVVVHPDGQRAETHVAVRRHIRGWATLVDVRLLTGRKHQIRVHLQHAGHPIAGDERYGAPRFNNAVKGRGGSGLHLHAAKMVIPRSDGTELQVTAPMPARWERLLNNGL